MVAAADLAAARHGRRSPRKQAQRLGHERNGGDHNGANDNDPHDLEYRFVRLQREMFATALAEIRQGQKQSCWLWFVLPTAPYFVHGIERGSDMNRRFALRSDPAVQAYLTLETKSKSDNGDADDDNDCDGGGLYLRRNYIAMLEAIRGQLEYGNTMESLFGPLDNVKAISSFRLFERIATEMNDTELYSVCRKVLALTERGKKR